MTIIDVTKTIGTYIRDTLRADATILSLLGITAGVAQNYIFFTRPLDQTQGFANPRIVVETSGSTVGKLGFSEFYQGSESFLISAWVDDKPFTNVLDLNERIVQLFNKTNYNFTSSGVPINFGTFRVDSKISFDEPDKQNTKKGEISITLTIGET